MSEHPGKQFSSEYQPKSNGRKKGSLSLKTIIRELWETDVIDKDTQLPIMRAVQTVKAMLEKAEGGDVHAFKTIADRLEGLPKQSFEGDVNHNMNFYEQMIRKHIPENIVDKSTE